MLYAVCTIPSVPVPLPLFQPLRNIRTCKGVFSRDVGCTCFPRFPFRVSVKEEWKFSILLFRWREREHFGTSFHLTVSSNLILSVRILELSDVSVRDF